MAVDKESTSPERRKYSLEDFPVSNERDEAAEAWADETSKWAGVPSARTEGGEKDGDE